MGIEVGISIGSSKDRTMCGVAVSWPVGTQLKAWTGVGRSWKTASREIRCAAMTIDNAIGLMERLVRDKLEGVSIAIDGPLGPKGPPSVHRHVDRECQKGEFQGRAVPASVVGAGRTVVETTYRVTEAAVGAWSGPSYRFSASRDPAGPAIQFFETMPTVGLAVLLPKVGDVAAIPSREKPINGVGERSDFYWTLGAGEIVGGFLGVADLAEKEHDRRTALYCLVVAQQLNGVCPGKPFCIGDVASGVYVLASPEHPSWTAELTRVGRVAP